MERSAAAGQKFFASLFQKRRPCFLVFFLLPFAAIASDAACKLSQTDLVANAQLSFDDFDQKGTTPTTWRWFDDHHCYPQAAEAAEDYLMHARFQSSREQRDVTFHLAQTFAVLDDRPTAAALVGAAKDPSQPANTAFDWNTYLEGTWAFLTRHHDALDFARARLRAQGGRGNLINANALDALAHCFDKPYVVAYASACHVER